MKKWWKDYWLFGVIALFVVVYMVAYWHFWPVCCHPHWH